jgi:hypothetical protein
LGDELAVLRVGNLLCPPLFFLTLPSRSLTFVGLVLAFLRDQLVKPDEFGGQEIRRLTDPALLETREGLLSLHEQIRVDCHVAPTNLRASMSGYVEADDWPGRRICVGKIDQSVNQPDRPADV